MTRRCVGGASVTDCTCGRYCACGLFDVRRALTIAWLMTKRVVTLACVLCAHNMARNACLNRRSDAMRRALSTDVCVIVQLSNVPYGALGKSVILAPICSPVFCKTASDVFPVRVITYRAGVNATNSVAMLCSACRVISRIMTTMMVAYATCRAVIVSGVPPSDNRMPL